VSKVLNVSLLEGTTYDTCCVLKRIICTPTHKIKEVWKQNKINIIMMQSIQKIVQGFSKKQLKSIETKYE
jgi:hypothetical protein